LKRLCNPISLEAILYVPKTQPPSASEILAKYEIMKIVVLKVSSIRSIVLNELLILKTIWKSSGEANHG
jgi:hypothetical protein